MVHVNVGDLLVHGDLMAPVPPVIGLDVERVEPAVDGRGIIETGGLAVAQFQKETVWGIEAPEEVCLSSVGSNTEYSKSVLFAVMPPCKRRCARVSKRPPC